MDSSVILPLLREAFKAENEDMRSAAARALAYRKNRQMIMAWY